MEDSIHPSCVSKEVFRWDQATHIDDDISTGSVAGCVAGTVDDVSDWIIKDWINLTGRGSLPSAPPLHPHGPSTYS